MSTKNWFQLAGIGGWDSVQTVILATLLADQRPLLIGEHGSNKTEGARAISNLILGKAHDFRHFEVPILNTDDLFGYPNPKALSDGKLEFVDTPLAIWGAQSVLFDEINRSSPFVQGKLHELVRTKRLMGKTTRLELVFSAINPPGSVYDSGYMGLAFASRFVSIQVPASSAFSEDTMIDILMNAGTGMNHSTLSDEDAAEFLGLWEQAKAFRMDAKTKETVGRLLAQILQQLLPMGIKWSTRQMVNCLALIEATMALDSVGLCGPDKNWVLTQLALGTIPEVHGICSSQVDMIPVQNVLSNALSNVVMSVQVADMHLMQLIEHEHFDPPAHHDAIRRALLTVKDPKMLMEAATKLADANVLHRENLVRLASNLAILRQTNWSVENLEWLRASIDSLFV